MLANRSNMMVVRAIRWVLGPAIAACWMAFAHAEPRWKTEPLDGGATAEVTESRSTGRPELPSAADADDRNQGSAPSADSPEPRFARVKDSQHLASGQVWREYDLRPYLTRVRGLEEPQQPIVDWILRETGTESWFGSTPGLLSVEQEKLRVYHLPEVQAIVADVVDRYVHPELPGYGVSVRLVTVQSVNWRTVAMAMMEPIRVETAGVEAWTLTRESYLLLMAHLRQRVDVQEHNSATVQIAHGQSHQIQRYQPRSYPQSVERTPDRYPGYQLQMGQIQEGFSLRISPLLTTDARTVDAVVNCNVDQLEKLTPLTLDLPVRPGAALGKVQIEVPQVASWRLNERFRWPVDRVLLISRGVVAVPGMGGNQTLWAKALSVGAPRADALLFLECQQLEGDTKASGLDGARVGRLNYHGRY